MSRQALIKLGALTEYSEDLYKFGHAADICFGSFMDACDYDSKDLQQRAILGISMKAAEFRGEVFLNGKSEGILHEGPLSLTFCLQQLIVPDERVAEYEMKAKAGYLLDVFPFSNTE